MLKQGRQRKPVPPMFAFPKPTAIMVSPAYYEKGVTMVIPLTNGRETDAVLFTVKNGELVVIDVLISRKDVACSVASALLVTKFFDVPSTTPFGIEDWLISYGLRTLKKDMFHLVINNIDIKIAGKKTEQIITAIGKWRTYYSLLKTSLLDYFPPPLKNINQKSLTKNDEEAALAIASVVINPTVRITPNGRILINGAPAKDVLNKIRFRYDSEYNRFMDRVNVNLVRELNRYFEANNIPLELETSSIVVYAFRRGDKENLLTEFVLPSIALREYDDLKNFLLSLVHTVPTNLAAGAPVDHDFLVTLVGCSSVNGCDVRRVVEAMIIGRDADRLASALIDKGYIRKVGKDMVINGGLLQKYPIDSPVIYAALGMLGITNPDRRRIEAKYISELLSFISVMPNLRNSKVIRNNLRVVNPVHVDGELVTRVSDGLAYIWPGDGVAVLITERTEEVYEEDIDTVSNLLTLLVANEVIKKVDVSPLKIQGGKHRLVIEGNTGKLLNVALTMKTEKGLIDTIIVHKVPGLSEEETAKLFHRIATDKASVTIERGTIFIDGVPYTSIMKAVKDNQDASGLVDIFVLTKLPSEYVNKVMKRLLELADEMNIKIKKEYRGFYSRYELREVVKNKIIDAQERLRGNVVEDNAITFHALLALSIVGDEALIPVLGAVRVEGETVVIDPLRLWYAKQFERKAYDILALVKVAVNTGCQATNGSIKCTMRQFTETIKKYLESTPVSVADALPLIIRSRRVKDIVEKVIEAVKTKNDVALDDTFWKILDDKEALKELTTITRLIPEPSQDEELTDALSILANLKAFLEKMLPFYTAT